MCYKLCNTVTVWQYYVEESYRFKIESADQHQAKQYYMWCKNAINLQIGVV